jgi:hypothetical protein
MRKRVPGLLDGLIAASVDSDTAERGTESLDNAELSTGFSGFVRKLLTDPSAMSSLVKAKHFFVIPVSAANRRRMCIKFNAVVGKQRKQERDSLQKSASSLFVTSAAENTVEMRPNRVSMASVQSGDDDEEEAESVVASSRGASSRMSAIVLDFIAPSPDDQDGDTDALAAARAAAVSAGKAHESKRSSIAGSSDEPVTELENDPTFNEFWALCTTTNQSRSPTESASEEAQTMNASFQFQMVKADVQQVGGNALRNILLFVHRMAFIESTSFISRWLILPSNMMHPQQDRVTALKTLRVLNEDRVALPEGVYSGLYSTAVWFDRAATRLNAWSSGQA